MKFAPSSSSRGLTLIELLLALTITALVAAAIAGMMGAVSTGVGTRRDNRAVMVRTSAAQSRISSYIAPARCVLAVNQANITLWLNDSRQGQTVHGTELRWLRFDADTGIYSVHFVAFPSDWTQADKDAQDLVHASNSNWETVFSHYKDSGWTLDIPLVDGLASLAVIHNANTAVASTHFAFTLDFSTSAGSTTSALSATIYAHRVPSS